MDDFQNHGRMFDFDTGLQNNLNRWYDPTVGQWISKDPIGFAAGDANLYRYVGNSPTNATDPNGLEARENWDVEIVVQPFIPQFRVNSPFGWFAGDDRGLDVTPGQEDNDYRMRLYTKYIRGKLSYTTDAGVTYRYADDNPASKPIEQAEAKEGAGMNHRSFTWRKNNHERFFRQEGIGGNPLIKRFGAGFNPKINYGFTLIYDCRDDTIRVYSGRHDGFPSYEVFARHPGGDWKKVYYHDATNHDPIELFGRGDVQLREQRRVKL